LNIFLNFLILTLLCYITIDRAPYLTAKSTAKVFGSKNIEDIGYVLSIPGALLSNWFEEIIKRIGNDFLARIISFCLYAVTVVISSWVFRLLGNLFFGEIFSSLESVISSLISGDGLSIFQIFRVLFIGPFQLHGFLGGLWRLGLLIGFNAGYFLMLWGFLAEKDNDGNYYENSLLTDSYASGDYALVVSLFLLAIIFITSLFMRATTTNNVFTILLHFADELNLSSLITPAIMQVTTMTLPVTIANIATKKFFEVEDLSESNQFTGTKKNRK